MGVNASHMTSRSLAILTCFHLLRDSLVLLVLLVSLVKTTLRHDILKSSLFILNTEGTKHNIRSAETNCDATNAPCFDIQQGEQGEQGPNVMQWNNAHFMKLIAETFLGKQRFQ